MLGTQSRFQAAFACCFTPSHVYGDRHLCTSTTSTRHPLRGLTVGRGALGARVGLPAGPHDGDGGSLEARLAARPSPLLAVEGLTVGGGPGLAVAGVDMNGVVEMVGVMFEVPVGFKGQLRALEACGRGM